MRNVPVADYDLRPETLLSPVVLARIDDLELLARTVVEGFMHGLHKSLTLGVSTDFSEHRAYMPGDDLRRIDWRLFARTDRFHVKEYEAETNANVLLLVDTSASMGFAGGGRGHSKLDYARMLAASLAYFSARQHDRVGLVLFDEEISEYVPPSVRGLTTILHVLARARARGKGGLDTPVRSLVELVRRRGIIILIGDLYEPSEVVADAVARLRGRGNDVILFQVLDPDELAFPYRDAASFRDMETGERMPLIAEEVRAKYRDAVAAHIDSIAKSMADQRADHRVLTTDQPLDEALFAYLSDRHRLSRVR